MSLIAPYEYFAPNTQKADPGAPGATEASPLAGPGRRRSLFGWVGLLGLATYAGGMPVAI